MFLKRLSRSSRANSYAEDDYDRPRSQDAKYNTTAAAPDSPRQSTSQHNNFGPSSATATSPTKETARDMYPRPHGPQEAYARGPTNGSSSRHASGAGAAFDGAAASSSKMEHPPDLLARAFNEAVRPYTEKIDHLEGQVAELQNYVDQMEAQRAEMHAWIDKRGLRPDVPPAISKAMDSLPDSAAALNAQLDRKITIVNFDLHRLQDDLNDSISSSHFASAMAKFLPDISRLSALPSGARFAFDLVLKLGGNLNSHGGLDSSAHGADAAADLAARRDFYARLDTAMLEVVRRRFQEGEDWAVQREIKRIEKTAAYLRNFGIEPYFPTTLDAMRREVEFRHSAPTTGAGLPPAQTPPKY